MNINIYINITIITLHHKVRQKKNIFKMCKYENPSIVSLPSIFPNWNVMVFRTRQRVCNRRNLLVTQDAIHFCLSYYIYYNKWDEVTYPFPTYNDATVEVWEWIHNFVPHFTMRLITYPCWVNSIHIN